MNQILLTFLNENATALAQCQNDTQRLAVIASSGIVDKISEFPVEGEEGI